jgi:hypothetical protein
LSVAAIERHDPASAVAANIAAVEQCFLASLIAAVDSNAKQIEDRLSVPGRVAF